MTPTLLQVTGFFTAAGLAAAGAAAISIPVTIHLLTRLRRKPQRWAAMRFLIEAYRRQRQRIQLEQLLLLLVRCLMVALLGLALSGPLLGGVARKLGVDAAGRTVFLLIDDSLSTQAREPAQGERFERLRKAALNTIDGLGSADRVAVWTVARPTLTPIGTPVPDRAAARQLIASLKPRHARADWPAALAALRQEIARINQPADRVAVMLLSDFSLSTLDTARPATETASSMLPARLLVTRPMSSLANAQVAAIVPRRTVALADVTGVVAFEAEARLRRFGVDLPESLTSVSVTARPVEGGDPVAESSREVRWAAGQTEASIQVELRAPLEILGLGAAGVNSRAFVLEARAIESSGADALPVDDARRALVEARRQITVAIADEPSVDRAEAAWFSRPRDWVEAALRPMDIRDPLLGPMRVTDLPAATLDEQGLRGVDALLVLRPDLITDTGWTTLAAWVNRGGFVWFFVPPSDAPAVWSTKLTEKLTPLWRLSLEPQTAGDTPGSPDAPGVAWRLNGDHPAPEAMRLLSTDWPALIRPVMVSRRIVVTSKTGAETAWLRLADAGDHDALLTLTDLGEGKVMLLASAIDPAWTNLPTKPVFVPLLHETLRAVIGAPGEAQRLNAVISGDQPTLGARWDAAESVSTAEGHKLTMKRTDAGVTLISHVDLPGIYAAQPGGTPRFIVNPDADAADTRALDEASLSRWLKPLGEWKWIDPDQPLATLAAQSPRADIGWPLLWAVLALTLLETALARWFSHAGK